jgi:hypothetical protein
MEGLYQAVPGHRRYEHIHPYHDGADPSVYGIGRLSWRPLSSVPPWPRSAAPWWPQSFAAPSYPDHRGRRPATPRDLASDRGCLARAD